MEKTISQGNTYGPIWSVDGHAVAFYSDADGYARIWLYDTQSARSRRVSSIVVHPRDILQYLIWSPDGTTLYTKAIPENMTVHDAIVKYSDAINPTAARDPDATITARTFRSGDGPQQSSSASPSTIDLPSSLAETADLVRVDVRSGRVDRLIRESRIAGLQVSPDGRYLSFASGRGYLSASQHQKVYSLTLYDLKTGQSQVLLPDWLTNYGYGYSWSPNSEFIAAVEYDYNGSSYDQNGGQCIILGRSGRVYARSRGAHFFQYDFWGPPWAADSRTLYLKSRDSIDVYNASENTFRRLVSFPDSDVLAVAASSTAQVRTYQGNIFAFIRDRESKIEHLVSISPTGSADIGSDEYLSISTYPHQPERNIEIIPDTNEIAVIAETASRPFDVVVFSEECKTAQRLETKLNPKLEGLRLPDPRLLKWIGIHGETLYGDLLLPPNVPEGAKLRTIVVQYPHALLSEARFTFGFGGPSFYVNWDIFANAGFAVFAIDFPLESYEINEVSGQLDTALTALRESGVADATRVGLYGCSQGAYAAVAAIEGGDHFRAAVVDSPIQLDLVGVYLTMEANGGASGGAAWVAHGYANMGGRTSI